MSVIRVDYDNVRRQTQKLQAATDNCDKVVRKLKTHIGQLYSYWEGESAEAFISSVQARIRDIKDIKENIEMVAANISQVADGLEKKEKEIIDATSLIGTIKAVDGRKYGSRSGGGH